MLPQRFKFEGLLPSIIPLLAHSPLKLAAHDVLELDRPKMVGSVSAHTTVVGYNSKVGRCKMHTRLEVLPKGTTERQPGRARIRYTALMQDNHQYELWCLLWECASTWNT